MNKRILLNVQIGFSALLYNNKIFLLHFRTNISKHFRSYFTTFFNNSPKSSSSEFGYVAYIFIFKCPPRKKSTGVRSGDLGGY